MFPRSAILGKREYGQRLPGNNNYSGALIADPNTDYRAYNMQLTVVHAGGNVVVQDGCFAIMFTNIGTEAVRVNGKLLLPSAAVLPLTALGDSFTMGGHLRDLYYGNITVEFLTNAVQPALEIVQLFYVGVLKNRIVQK